MSVYKEELDSMVWSFSRIHLYETCPFAFYLKYIERRDGISNFFADNGTAMHTVCEEFLKKKLSLDDIAARYVELFEEIDSDISPTIRENTFNKCLDYLSVFEPNFEEKYETVGVELKCDFMVGEKKFTGYIDLLLKDKTTGELILVDHKSADHFLKKNGTVLKNQEENFRNYKHQMYLYSKEVFEKFGAFPAKIVWHHFKDNGQLTIIDFNEKDYKESLEWANDTIEQIYQDDFFEEKQEFMMCSRLCDFRENCEYREEEEA